MLKSKLETVDYKEYSIEAIHNNEVYTNGKTGRLPELYYSVLWKDYIGNYRYMGANFSSHVFLNDNQYIL